MKGVPGTALASDLPPEDRREALIEEAKILAELDDRERKFPIWAYKPIPKLKAFHASRSRVRILSGGNRSGKSHVGVAEGAAYLLGYRPWVLREAGLPMPEQPWLRPPNLPQEAICFNCAGVRVPVPCRIFMVTGQSMRKGVAETLWPKFQELLGPLITKTHVAHSGVIGDFTLKNGSQCFFGSVEQGGFAFESTNYAYNGIDEPISRSVYVGISRGSIDQFAPICMTFTPIGPWAAWIFRELYANNDLTEKEVGRFNISIFDNPYLDQEAISTWANDPTLSEQEKEIRLYGKFRHLTDQIYSNFREASHVVAPFNPPGDGLIGMVIDPHTIKPWAIAYFYIHPTGQIYFFKEWPAGEYTKQTKCKNSIEDYANLIRRLDGALPVSIRLMDPNYGPRTDVIRGRYIPSVRDDLARFGLHFNTSLNDDIEHGEQRVRSLLAWDDTREMDSLNRPKLYFTENCKNLIASMLYYTAKRRPDSDTYDEKKRDETYKDFADVVRYVAVSPIGQMGGFTSFDEDQFGPVLSTEHLGDTGYGE